MEKIDLSSSFVLRDGDDIRPLYTLGGAARACGQEFEGKPVNAEQYIQSEALSSFISGETDFAHVHALAGSIHDSFSGKDRKVTGKYKGEGNNPVDVVTRSLQREIGRLMTAKKTRDSVSVDEYIRNEALAAFLDGVDKGTSGEQIESIVRAILDKLSMPGVKLRGLGAVLKSSDPFKEVRRIFIGENSRFSLGEGGMVVRSGGREDEKDGSTGEMHEGGNGNGNGNGGGKSERLTPGWVGEATVVKLFSDGFKVTVPGGGKSVAVYCSKTGGFKAGQTVKVRMTGERDAWKNPVAELVS